MKYRNKIKLAGELALNRQQENKKSFALNILCMLLASWLVAVSVLQLPIWGETAALYDLEAIAGLSLTIFVVSFLTAFCLFFILQYFLKIKTIYCLLTAAVVYTLLIVIQAEPPLLLGISILWLVIIYYFRPKRRDVTRQLEPPGPLPPGLRLIIIGVAILHICIMSAIMIYRLKGFNAPTYDDGIFSQLFYQMRIDGSQVTTLERSYPLSHFAIHVSPILYLLLPFYSILPRPETLQFLQILVVASGIFPLLLIMNNHKFPAAARFFFSVLYFFLPALSCSSFYGFHDNCFLVPLLLWLFFALERSHLVGTIAASILLLGVKEDVVIYFIFIGLWLLFNKRRKAGAGLIILSGLVFVFEIFFMNKFGEGTLAASRFPNVSAFPGMGLLGIIPTFLLSPAYFFTQVFTVEKWLYIVQMLLPFAFTPLFQRKKPSRLLLLFPFIIINLISSYQYLYMIDFQYNYGNAAILLYLCVLFWSDVMPSIDLKAILKPNASIHKRQKIRTCTYSLIAVLSLAFAIIITSMLWNDRLSLYRYVQNYRDESKKVELALADIPENVSVRASTFYTTALSNRQRIYDIDFGDGEKADTELSDYYVYDLRYTFKEEVLEEMASLLHSGWVEYKRVEDWLLIIRKADLP